MYQHSGNFYFDRNRGICLHFALQNKGFSRSNPRKQQSTGLLDFIFQISPLKYRTK